MNFAAIKAVPHASRMAALRMMMLIVVVAFADALVGFFAPRPFPWVAIVPGLIPILSVPLVILPMLTKRETA